MSYTTVTTLEPLVTGTYPATVVDVVISSVSLSYVEIYTDWHGWISTQAYLNTVAETVVVVAAQTAVVRPTGAVQG